MAKFCPNCGSPVKARDKFCQNCGGALSGRAKAVKPKPRVSAASKAKATTKSVLQTYRSPTLVWLGGGFAAMALIALVAVLMLTGRDRGAEQAHQSAGPGDAAKGAAAEEGDIAYFGAQVGNLTPAQATELGLGQPRGARLHTIVNEGPAQKAGLQDGDIILEIGGQPVADVASFLKILVSLKPDSQTNLRILRGHEERVVAITVGALLRETVPAANAGDVRAMRWLASLFFSDRLGPPDPAEAMRWLAKAANAGDERSMHEYAGRLWNGTDTAKDRGQALRLWQGAARKGNVNAMLVLGRVHYYGHGLDGKKDYSEAMRLFLLAADQGNAEAMIKIGFMHEKALGTRKDLAEAVLWYRKAAVEGDATAMHNLGVSYNLGQGVSQNHAEAAAWYRKALAAKSTLPLYNLAVLYHNGQGVTQDREAAAEFAYRALKAGDDYAAKALTKTTHGWTPPFLRRLQDLMRQDSAYSGSIDGKLGPQMQRAIAGLAEKAKAGSPKSVAASTPRAGRPSGTGRGEGGLEDFDTLD